MPAEGICQGWGPGQGRDRGRDTTLPTTSGTVATQRLPVPPDMQEGLNSIPNTRGREWEKEESKKVTSEQSISLEELEVPS